MCRWLTAVEALALGAFRVMAFWLCHAQLCLRIARCKAGRSPAGNLSTSQAHISRAAACKPTYCHPPSLPVYSFDSQCLRAPLSYVWLLDHPPMQVRSWALQRARRLSLTFTRTAASEGGAGTGEAGGGSPGPTTTHTCNNGSAGMQPQTGGFEGSGLGHGAHQMTSAVPGSGGLQRALSSSGGAPAGRPVHSGASNDAPTVKLGAHSDAPSAAAATGATAAASFGAGGMSQSAIHPAMTEFVSVPEWESDTQLLRAVLQLPLGTAITPTTPSSAGTSNQLDTESQSNSSQVKAKANGDGSSSQVPAAGAGASSAARPVAQLLPGGRLGLSAGQQQLLCVARMLLAPNKQLVLLDEVGACVDHTTSRVLERVLGEQLPGCAVVQVAHALHAVMGYDRVIVMEKGVVVEGGHPHALLAERGSRFGALAAAYGGL